MSLCGQKNSTKPLRLSKHRWSLPPHCPTLIYPNRPASVQTPVAKVWDSSYNRKPETHGPSSKPAQDSYPVVRHAVLEQYNYCRSRKSIRGYIPMYIFAAVYFLYFLQALFVSDFTSRTPNKDKQVEQPFHCRFVQVL